MVWPTIDAQVYRYQITGDYKAFAPAIRFKAMVTISTISRFLQYTRKPVRHAGCRFPLWLACEVAAVDRHDDSGGEAGGGQVNDGVGNLLDFADAA